MKCSEMNVFHDDNFRESTKIIISNMNMILNLVDVPQSCICSILSFVCCTNQCEWLSWVKLLLCDLKFFRCTVYVCMKTFKVSCLQIEKNNLLWRTQWLHYCSQKAYFIDILFFFVCHEKPTNCSPFFK